MIFMTTSIQITENTLEKLKKLKDEMKISSYDDLINALINKAQITRESMFGIDKGKLKRFSEEDRIDFREY